MHFLGLNWFKTCDQAMFTRDLRRDRQVSQSFGKDGKLATLATHPTSETAFGSISITL